REQLVDQRRVLTTGALGVADDVGVLAEQLEIDHASQPSGPARAPRSATATAGWSDAEQFEEGVLLEHARRVDRGGCPAVGVRTRLEERADDLAVPLEHRSRQRRLAPVVGAVH